jgi:hypothetical protein
VLHELLQGSNDGARNWPCFHLQPTARRRFFFNLPSFVCRALSNRGFAFFTLLRPSIAPLSSRAPRRLSPIGLRALPGKALRAIAQTHERTFARTISRYPVLH